MTSQEQNNYLKKAAAIAGVSLAVLLIVLKLAAFIKTDSLAIFSSLADSVTDLFASAVSFAAVYFQLNRLLKNIATDMANQRR